MQAIIMNKPKKMVNHMQITVQGHQIDVGDALRTHAEDVLEKITTKYFDRAIEATVFFSRESSFFKVNITVNEGTGAGMMIRAEGQDAEIYQAFDKAAERVEKQLRRYKRRLKDHHKDKKDEFEVAQDLIAASKYVIKNDGESGEESKGDEEQLIIAEKAAAVEVLTVSDAVMRMNLMDLPALMFINKKSGNINVVYHRKDGNISWVDASVKSADAKTEAA
jgi:ribosomal subunit interface protein